MRKNITSPSVRRATTAEAIPRAGTGPEIMFSSNFGNASHNQTFEWRNTSTTSQPRTAPVSPYMQTNPEPTGDAKRSQKRKSESSPVDISLTIPQETNVPQIRSAPPERPRKIPRSRGHSIPQTALPIQNATFISPGISPSNFIFTTSISAPSFYPGTLPKPTSVGSAELLPDYFLTGTMGMEEWIPPVEYMYHPHIVQPRNLPAVTNVGVAVTGARHDRYLNEQ